MRQLMGTGNHPGEVLQCEPCCQGTWLGCCSPTAAGTAGNTQSCCWLPAAFLPPSNTTSGEGGSSPLTATNPHRTVTPGSFPTGFNKNPTQEKAILNYCPDSASQDREAEKQLSCRFPAVGATVSSCRGMEQPWGRGCSRSSRVLHLSCCCFSFCPVKSSPRL